MSAILVTGADGYVGSRVAVRLLRDDTRPLMLWMRAADEIEFEKKKQGLQTLLGGSHDHRVRYLWGDLRSQSPFAGVDTLQVGTILHTAAVIRFNVEEEIADNVNVEGTKKALAFAEACPGLKNFCYLSTVYASGDVPGSIAEVPFPNARFVNHYERSKNAAEAQVMASPLPWQVARLATVIADDASGKVTQQNAFHNTLRLLYNGLMSLIPGEEDTPLYFVTGDFAADALTHLVRQGHKHLISHIVHTKEESATLGDLLNLVFDVFGENEDFKRRRILRPMFANQESFDVMAKAMQGLSRGVLSDALGSITPFAAQLYVKKDMKNDSLRANWSGYAAPDPSTLIRATVRQLVATSWGRKP